MIAVAEKIEIEVEATITAQIGVPVEADLELTPANDKDPVEEAKDTSSAIPLPTPAMSGDELFRLGMMYSTGQGGAPLDLVSAHMLFNLAAMKGSKEAGVYRRELSLEMEREDIAEAQRAARRWLDQGSTQLHA